MTKKLTQVTVRDLTDYKIATAIAHASGRSLYDEAVKLHGVADVNIRMFRGGVALDHPGVTDAELEDMLAKKSPDEIMAVVERFVEQTYNHLMIVALPKDDGSGDVFAVALSHDDGVKGDPGKNIAKVAEEYLDAQTQDGQSVSELPVILFKEVDGEPGNFKPVPVKVDLKTLAEEIAAKQG